MHLLHPAFQMSDAQAWAFAAQRGFGLLTAYDGEKPVGSHLPFVVKTSHEGNHVQLHVARSNPLADLADGTRMFLLAVSGLDAYVSNDWYASKDQVSTWLYEAVHLTGTARQLPIASNRGHGDALLDVTEDWLSPKKAWTLDAMDTRKREAMLSAIITIEMHVVHVEGQRKFNQHKSDLDYFHVMQALEKSDDLSVQKLAATLRELRPHLDYTSSKTPQD